MNAGGPHQWTVRDEKRGGDLLPAIKSKFGPCNGYKKLIIWIHGFNTNEHSAIDQWEKSYEQVCQISGREWLKGTVWFFWPGEATSNKYTSTPLYYPQVSVAENSGNLLAQYLFDVLQKNPKLQITLVAHSLGCRVALQAANRLLDLEGPQIWKILLFAAAVPVGLCEPERIYGKRLAKSEDIMWSESDSVLKRWFQSGQKLARLLKEGIDPGIRKEAVGLVGGPDARWTREQEASGFKHGDYWKDKLSLSLLAQMYGHVSQDRHPKEREVKERHNEER